MSSIATGTRFMAHQCLGYFTEAQKGKLKHLLLFKASNSFPRRANAAHVIIRMASRQTNLAALTEQ